MKTAIASVAGLSVSLRSGCNKPTDCPVTPVRGGEAAARFPSPYSPIIAKKIGLSPGRFMPRVDKSSPHGELGPRSTRRRTVERKAVRAGARKRTTHQPANAANWEVVPENNAKCNHKELLP